MEDWMDDGYFWRFRRSQAKLVRGGIKAQTAKFGKLWWAKKWLEAIETFGPSGRVARGRSYARKGQALQLEIQPGLIKAEVQGSRDEPYQIEIPLQQFTGDTLKKLLEELRTQPIFAATMLTGELPPEIETLFSKYAIPLFPSKAEGRLATCSCPDTSNPCKHIAAIYYLMSLELERDPFLLLLLRGIRREDLAPETQRNLFTIQEIEPLPADPKQFWRTPRLKQIPIVEEPWRADLSKPALLQRLGPFPFWRGESDFLKTMELMYERAREFARNKIAKD